MAFNEPEDFVAALRPIGLSGLLITTPGLFTARLTQVSLNQMRLMAAEEQLARVAFVTVPKDSALLLWPVGQTALPICSGVKIREGELAVFRDGGSFHARTGGSARWDAICLPAAQLATYALTAKKTVFAPAVMPWQRPRPSALRRLQSLHAGAIQMTRKHPQAMINMEAASALKRQLIHAIVECLSGGATALDTRTGHRNRDMMVRFEQLLRTQAPIQRSITEISARLGVSERALRYACAEHLGMSPTAYDRLRRMSLVRAALQRADPASEQVSAIARNNGFSALGRFAAKYHALFGENPSVTLRQGRRLMGGCER